MYEFIIEVGEYGEELFNIFDDYIMADTEEEALEIANQWIKEQSNFICDLSSYEEIQVDVHSEYKFKAVYKAKRKNAVRHIAYSGTYRECIEHVRTFNRDRYDITIEDFNGNVIKHCK